MITKLQPPYYYVTKMENNLYSYVKETKMKDEKPL